MPESEPITAVRLRRGACFGTCPIYELTLHADGTAEWDGERFVPRVGKFEGGFDPNDFEKLARFVERAGFFGWKDQRTEFVDLPEYVLTAVAGTRTHSVSQLGTDEPEDFWVIAEVVDGIGGAVDWQEVPDGLGCRGWSATLTNFGISAPLLTVRGVCTFRTGGFSVELRRHDPQPEDPAHLVLDKVVTEPTGPSTDAITDVEVTFTERIASIERVTILPDGIIVEVEVLNEPPDSGTEGSDVMEITQDQADKFVQSLKSFHDSLPEDEKQVLEGLLSRADQPPEAEAKVAEGRPFFDKFLTLNPGTQGGPIVTLKFPSDNDEGGDVY